jgi:pimeloyl-ACP methyl ester carboxylesterase
MTTPPSLLCILIRDWEIEERGIGRNQSKKELTMQTTKSLTARNLSSPRHTTRYWEAGPADGPLMIFLHGWPEVGLMWRAQVEAFASEGWYCIAPDMRGYGGSSAPAASEAYTLKEIVEDMVELHDHLGARPAIWVGHDLGSPVAGALAAHHTKRCSGVVFTSVPYSTNIRTDSGITTAST